MEKKYNLKSPAVKRLMREAVEMRLATEEYFAQPIEENLFEWHFTVRGPPETDFDGGVYHGRIILPPEYPMKPPTIILLTPNGRFEVNRKICLSISGHHPESWQPSWSIRTVLLAIIGFMPTSGNGAIGSLDYTSQERWALAVKSKEWCCSLCGPIDALVLKPNEKSNVSASQEARDLAAQITFKGEPDRVSAKESELEHSSPLPDISSPQDNMCNGTNNSQEDNLSNNLPRQGEFPTANNGNIRHRKAHIPPMVTNDYGSNDRTNGTTSSSRNGKLSLLLMIILGLGIGVLLLRRLFILL